MAIKRSSIYVRLLKSSTRIPQSTKQTSKRFSLCLSGHSFSASSRTEIDGYAFCSGLSALNLSYEINQNLQGIIPPIAYLIRGAVFRPRYEGCETSQSGRFSLDIRPLSELVDMYHTRKATNPLDKIYALLGISSDNHDDLNKAGLLPNY
ncbi:unnamed protein product [Clonostachys solani]|uniref:Uncharacterized protein n=1 Tax=Clonostachys solani TaxID=160281 RepID=A0A9P0EQF4_9HYPO|nr:unnamed protein product [Clonostachys solani]